MSASFQTSSPIAPTSPNSSYSPIQLQPLDVKEYPDIEGLTMEERTQEINIRTRDADQSTRYTIQLPETPTQQATTVPANQIVDSAKSLDQKTTIQPEKFEWLDADLDDGAKEPFVWDRRETRCASCFNWINRLPKAVRYLGYSAIGTIILMLPGIIDLIFFIQNPLAWWRNYIPTVDGNGNPQAMVFGYPLVWWSIWATINWVVFWGIMYIVPLLPILALKTTYTCMGYVPESVHDTLIQVFRLMRYWIIFCLTFFVLVLSYQGTFPNPPPGLPQTLDNLLSAVFWSSLIWFAAKLGLALFARDFRRRTYRERLEKGRFQKYVLETIYRAIPESMFEEFKSSGMEGAEDVAAQRHYTRSATSKTDGLTGFIQNALDGSADVIVGDRPLPFDSIRDSKLIARDIYTFLSRQNNREEILLQDFIPLFPDERVAKKAFELFDINFNASVSKLEMKQATVEMYQDSVALEKSMQDTLQAVGKLDQILNAIVGFITILLILGSFLDVSGFIALLAAFWAGTAFALQNTIRNVVESIIFLFMTHPFDVGDRVMIDGQSYFVKELGLMSTVFTHTDGRQMYASNPQLASKLIYNIRRSGSQIETIVISVSIHTTNAQLDALANKLNAAIAKDFAKDFFPNIVVYIVSMSYDTATMNLELWLEHKQNFQSGNARWSRSTRFRKLLNDGIKEVGLEPGLAQVIHIAGVSEWYRKAIESGVTPSSNLLMGS